MTKRVKKKKKKKRKSGGLLLSSATPAPNDRNSQSSIKNLLCRNSLRVKSAMGLSVHLRQHHWSAPLLWRAYMSSMQPRLNPTHSSTPASERRRLPVDTKKQAKKEKP